MARPRGTESVPLEAIADALRVMQRDRQLVRRWTVATAVGLTEQGLRSMHRRRGLTWEQFVDLLSTSYAPLPHPLADSRRGFIAS